METSGYIHQLDPVLFRLGNVELYYYGLAYAIGFLGIHLWLRRRRNALGWDLADVYNFSILFAFSVLLFGRLFSVLIYHLDYYRQHIFQVFHYWKGGMATHGILLGGLVAILLFARLRRVSFWRLADEIVIPAAFFLALGRIGNFINGQICGTVTTAWWGVRFPGMEGFRHPVTLYEALKNLLLIPILLYMHKRRPAQRGWIAANFVFWYAFLRIFTDLFRDHGAHLLGIGRNQYFNALMVLCGLILMMVRLRRDEPVPDELPVIRLAARNQRLWIRKLALILIILFSLIIRSAWTPEVLQQKRSERKSVQSACEEKIHQAYEETLAIESTAFYMKGVNLWQ